MIDNIDNIVGKNVLVEIQKVTIHQYAVSKISPDKKYMLCHLSDSGMGMTYDNWMKIPDQISLIED